MWTEILVITLAAVFIADLLYTIAMRRKRKLSPEKVNKEE